MPLPPCRPRAAPALRPPSLHAEILHQVPRLPPRINVLIAEVDQVPPVAQSPAHAMPAAEQVVAAMPWDAGRQQEGTAGRIGSGGGEGVPEQRGQPEDRRRRRRGQRGWRGRRRPTDSGDGVVGHEGQQRGSGHVSKPGIRSVRNRCLRTRVWCRSARPTRAGTVRPKLRSLARVGLCAPRVAPGRSRGRLAW
jgi:hypothetical protein